MLFGGEINAEGVNVLLVFIELEVKMRAGSPSGGAYVADYLAFGDGDARVNPIGEAIQVGVAARVRGIMLQIDRLAVSAIPASFYDSAIANRPNRRASLCSEINAGVWEIGSKDGMKSRFRKMRSDGGKLEWKTQEGARQAPTFQIVIVPLAFLFFEIYRI